MRKSDFSVPQGITALSEAVPAITENGSAATTDIGVMQPESVLIANGFIILPRSVYIGGNTAMELFPNCEALPFGQKNYN